MPSPTSPRPTDHASRRDPDAATERSELAVADLAAQLGIPAEAITVAPSKQ